MVIYFFMLVIPLFFGIAHTAGLRFGRFALTGYFILLVLFTGLRDEVGADWSGYLNIFEIYRDEPFSEVFHTNEPGFFVLNYASNHLGFDIYGVNLVCALIFLYGVFSFAKKTPNPWVAISVVTPYLIYIISMSGVRQAASIGIGFFMLAHWKSLSSIAKTCLILFAFSIHNSALFFFAFMIIEMRGSLFWKLGLAAVMSATLFLTSNVDNAYETYNTRYVQNNLESSGAVFHVLLSAFPAALYLIFQKKISAVGMANPLVKIGAYMSILALPMIAVSSTGISRLSLYFSFIQMWIYPALIFAFKESRGVWLALSVGVALSVFIIYFQFGVTAFAYMPYKNLLFVPREWW